MERSETRIESNAPRRKIKLSGFTLIEMMIAMALTLVLVYALAEFFSIVGDSVRDSRATVEMSGQLRSVALRLHQDLQWRTAEVVPWSDQLRAPGYFEYQEGPGADHRPDGTNSAGSSLLGDFDDYLALTIEARGDDFQGRFNGGLRRSRFAEVIWFSGYRDLNTNGVWDGGTTPDQSEPRMLIRRQLIIDPSITSLPTGRSYSQVLDFTRDNDLSVRAVPAGGGTYNIVANSLADLSRRENRYAHVPRSAFPFRLNLDLPCPAVAYDSGGKTDVDRQFVLFDGEDVMITNLHAFDLRAFSQSVPVHADAAANAAEALLPGDPGYQVARGTSQIAAGGYVDLFYNRHLSSNIVPPSTDLFAGQSNYHGPFGNASVYDTWALAYEFDPAIGNGQAFNGIDDNNSGGIDDQSERQTTPPYNAPLRGLRARIRIYDPGSRIVRQVTVDSDFIAE